MPDVNLEKLVPLEVHYKLKNAKIAKKTFPMLERGVPYTIGKLKRKNFQLQAKNTPIEYMVRKIQPWEVLRLKIGNSRECLGSVPEHL